MRQRTMRNLSCAKTYTVTLLIITLHSLLLQSKRFPVVPSTENLFDIRNGSKSPFEYFCWYMILKFFSKIFICHDFLQKNNWFSLLWFVQALKIGYDSTYAGCIFRCITTKHMTKEFTKQRQYSCQQFLSCCQSMYMCRLKNSNTGPETKSFQHVYFAITGVSIVG